MKAASTVSPATGNKYPPKSATLLAIRFEVCAMLLTATSMFSTGTILADEVRAKAGEDTVYFRFEIQAK